jgi:precorrin-2 dehydrogenase / sirohydrochlorin ferrochelatase
MKFYPVNLNIAGRPCIVIGGGAVAERKAAGLLACDALVTVISPDLSAGLLALHVRKKLAWHQRPYRSGDLAGAFLVIAATDDAETQSAVQQEADRENILLNVADVPDRCSFILPSILSRGELTVSVSTGGNSPALAKQMREKLEDCFGPEYEVYVKLLGILRTAVLQQGLPPAVNKTIFQRLVHPDMPIWLRENNWPRIEGHLRSTLPEGISTTSSLGELKNRLQSSAASTCL